VIQSLYLDRLRSGEEPAPGGELRRYRLPLDTRAVDDRSTDDGFVNDRSTDDGSVDYELLLLGPVEFPMINYRRVCSRPYRYCYVAGHTEPQSTGLLDCLVKYDIETESKDVWSEPGVYPGEPVFVAREQAPEPGVETETAEDDGVVLSVLLDTTVDRSVLLVLDAVSFSELARVPLPAVFPVGFHGQWYPNDGQPHRTMP